MISLGGKMKEQKITKEQLETFKVSARLERYHPYNLTNLMLGMCLFIFVLTILAKDNTISNNFYRIIDVYTYIGFRLLIFSIVCGLIFLIKPIAIRFQQIQFLIFIIEGQIFSWQLILLGALAIASIADWREKTLVITILILSVLAFIVFVFSFIVKLKKIKGNEYSLDNVQLRNKQINEFHFSKSIFIGLGAVSSGISGYIGESAFEFLLVIFGIFFILLHT